MHLAVMRLGNSEKWSMWLIGLGILPFSRVILPAYSFIIQKLQQ
jgi:uncharacterized membrane protein YecN with MAPEG domain